MTQHFLTDAEMHALICVNPFTLGLSIARLKDFMRQVEKAVLAKLHEQQEPIGYLHANELSFLSAKGITAEQARADDYNIPLYAHSMSSPSNMNDKPACVSESGGDDNRINALSDGTPKDEGTIKHLSYLKRYQKWRRGEDKTMCEMGLAPKKIGEALDWLIGVAENHIADASKMVSSDHIADASNMIWCACGDSFEPDTFGAGFIAARGQCQGCNAEDKSSVLAESKAKIIAASHRYADMRVAAALWLANEKDAAESYKALELRIAEELAIMQEVASNDRDMFRLRQKERGQREAISEWLELKDKIKKSGRPPHADYWNQSIYEAENKLRLSIQV